ITKAKQIQENETETEAIKFVCRKNIAPHTPAVAVTSIIKGEFDGTPQSAFTWADVVDDPKVDHMEMQSSSCSLVCS
ncbi:unnamed protein product, partial [Thlaspi arvense]